MIAALVEQRVILKLEQARLAVDQPQEHGYLDAHWDLFSAELALVRIKQLHQAQAIADACAGLSKPVQGRVVFLGRDWAHSPADTANAMRGKIGRVFSTGSWLDHCSVTENILLSQRHHTRTAMAALREEAALLAERFGLPGLPLDLPEVYNRADLQKSAGVRAFLGNPRLLLLEDPTFGVYPRILPALVNAIRQARNRGAAVLWMTPSDAVWQDETIPADRRFVVSGHELMEIKQTQ